MKPILTIIVLILIIFFFPKTKKISTKILNYQETPPKHLGFIKKDIRPDMVIYTCYGIFL